MRSRIVRWSIVVLLAASAVAGGLAYRHHQRYKHFRVHQEGMVYRSAWLEPDALQDVIEEYQIRTVVNLCAPGEMGEQRWIDEREAVRNSGARLVEIPMPTTLDVADPAIARHLTLMSDPDNYPMLVHCQHGVTRTAKFLAIYDIAFRNMSAQASLSAQPLFGRKRHNVNVAAFARKFEARHKTLYRNASAERLSILRR